MPSATVNLPDELFIVWSKDDIDSSFFEDHEHAECPNCGGPEGYSASQGYHAVGCVHHPNGPDPISLPRPLYVCSLCIDCEPESADLVRGYDPRDGIFERPGRVVESLGGIDCDPDGSYAEEIAAELLAAFEARRESVIERGTN